MCVAEFATLLSSFIFASKSRRDVLSITGLGVSAFVALFGVLRLRINELGYEDSGDPLSGLPSVVGDLRYDAGDDNVRGGVFQRFRNA